MRYIVVLALAASFATPLHAQYPVRVVLQPRADTTGMPRGCVDEAVRAVQNWFEALRTGDTALVRATMSSELAVFSVTPFVRPGSLWRGDSLADLQRYAQSRARALERDSLRAFIIAGYLPKDAGCADCRREILGFLPFFDRSATDLPAGRHTGLGKAGHQCGKGLWLMNVGPCMAGSRDQCAHLR